MEFSNYSTDFDFEKLRVIQKSNLNEIQKIQEMITVSSKLNDDLIEKINQLTAILKQANQSEALSNG